MHASGTAHSPEPRSRSRRWRPPRPPRQLHQSRPTHAGTLTETVVSITNSVQDKWGNLASKLAHIETTIHTSISCVGISACTPQQNAAQTKAPLSMWRRSFCHRDHEAMQCQHPSAKRSTSCEGLCQSIFIPFPSRRAVYESSSMNSHASMHDMLATQESSYRVDLFE